MVNFDQNLASGGPERTVKAPKWCVVAWREVGGSSGGGGEGEITIEKKIVTR